MSRATRLLARLGPELSSDPNWDAYRQLPRIDAFHRRMVRPLTTHGVPPVWRKKMVKVTVRRALQAMVSLPV